MRVTVIDGWERNPQHWVLFGPFCRGLIHEGELAVLLFLQPARVGYYEAQLASAPPGLWWASVARPREKAIAVETADPTLAEWGEAMHSVTSLWYPDGEG